MAKWRIWTPSAARNCCVTAAEIEFSAKASTLLNGGQLMPFRVTGVRCKNNDISGVTHLACLDADGDESVYAIADIIDFINAGCDVFTQVGKRRTTVNVVTGVRGPFLRTDANDSIEDNLLSLPRI